MGMPIWKTDYGKYESGQLLEYGISERKRGREMMKNKNFRKILITMAMCSALLAVDLSAAAAPAVYGAWAGMRSEADAAYDTLPSEPRETMRMSAGAGFYASVQDMTMVDGYYIRKVSAAEMGANPKALQAALDEAGTNATAARPYKVVLEPGKYTVNTVIRLLGNTCLYLEGVTFVQAKNEGYNMLVVGNESGAEKGYCYENITICGGTFDKNGNASKTLMKVGHAANFIMENVTMTNIKDAHFMEVAGVNGFTMRGCTVSNMTVTGKAIATYEAIQFDILVDKHIGGYGYEDLISQNILIEGCTFTNLSRGVGNHNAVLNNPMRGIEIKNNTFQNIKSLALRFMDVRNCSITGNTITGTPRAIEFDSVMQEGTYFGTTLDKSSGTPKKYIKPDADQQILVSGNTINCSGKDADGESPTVCVYLRGMEITKAVKAKDGDKVPKGDYYLSGVTIENNKMTTTQHAVFFRNGRNSTVNNNQIVCKGKTDSDDAIYLIQKSIDNTVTKNTIKNPSGSGISLYTKASAKLIADNKITSARNCGIFVDACTAEEITGNTISKPKKIGIVMTANSGSKNISRNTITSAPEGGINVGATNTDLNMSGNIIKKCGSAQILLNNNSTAQTIYVSKNTLTGKSTADGILCTGGNVVIANNKISSNRYSILLTDNVKGTVVFNTCKKNKHNDLSIGFGQYFGYGLAKPASLKAKAKGAKAAQLTWKAVSGAKGYQVFRATEKDGFYTKVATVSKPSYKDQKLKKKTTYYYKVVACNYSGNKNIAVGGDFSQTVTLKTK